MPGFRTSIARAILAALIVIGFSPAVLNAQEIPRILWRFELPGQYVPVDPVRAADGTLYVMDLLGALHAVDPEGNEIWSLAGVGPWGLDIGPDGILYTGNDFAVTAVNPDGTVRWVYPLDPIALVTHGPSVGPDGNLYFVNGNISPPGAVISLTPEGALRWSTTVGIASGSTARPVFGPAPDGGGQFVFSAGNLKARVDIDTGELDAFAGGGGLPVVTNIDGNIFHIGDGYDWFGNTLFLGLGIIEAASLDGTVYRKMGNSISRLDPDDGSPIWTFIDETGAGQISPNPSDTRLLYGGPGNALQPPAEVHYPDTAGSLLWSLDLPVDDGRVSAMWTRAIFTPDGSKAYFGSTTLFQGTTPNCFLYALEVEGTPGIPCSDVQRFVARCGSRSRVLVRTNFTDQSHSGEAVTISVDGVPQLLTISGKRASYRETVSSGVHTVELIDPAGCFPEIVLTCP